MIRAKLEPRRFPPPWSVADLGGAWRVADASGFTIVRFYFDDRHHVGTGFDHLTRAEAYAMAVNFARLPALLGASGVGSADPAGSAIVAKQ